MRSIDRIIKLEKVDPKKKDAGVFDPRVFTGENNLHAVMADNCMWTLKYEHGAIPPALRMKFTDFKSLYIFVDDYLKNKNIKITEVIE